MTLVRKGTVRADRPAAASSSSRCVPVRLGAGVGGPARSGSSITTFDRPPSTLHPIRRSVPGRPAEARQSTRSSSPCPATTGRTSRPRPRPGVRGADDDPGGRASPSSLAACHRLEESTGVERGSGSRAGRVAGAGRRTIPPTGNDAPARPMRHRPRHRRPMRRKSVILRLFSKLRYWWQYPRGFRAGGGSGRGSRRPLRGLRQFGGGRLGGGHRSHILAIPGNIAHRPGLNPPSGFRRIRVFTALSPRQSQCRLGHFPSTPPRPRSWTDFEHSGKKPLMDKRGASERIQVLLSATWLRKWEVPMRHSSTPSRLLDGPDTPKEYGRECDVTRSLIDVKPAESRHLTPSPESAFL